MIDDDDDDDDDDGYDGVVGRKEGGWLLAKQGRR